MTPERWQTVKDALASALALSARERPAYLEAVAATDPDLRREVESLLAHHTEGPFLEEPAVPGPFLTAGDTFGPYQIQSSLGEGGMGMVYLAQEHPLERPVALKFLSRGLQQQDEARRRFLREAKSAAALDHPYICKIYQTGEHDGRPFIAMEYVRGETLRRRLDTQPLSLKDVVRIALEVAEALEAAHAAQIVHRDLKPSNIMLTIGGHVKVLDFGLAKRVGGEDFEIADTRSELTEVGTVQGTVAYMSPEQVRGQSVDFRSDLFSLGVIVHECVSSTNPFQARTTLETAAQILNHSPAALGSLRKDVPALLEQIVQRLLAKTAHDRYGSATELRGDLARVSEVIDRGDLPMSASPFAPDRSSTRPSPRTFVIGKRAIIGTVVAAALLLAGVGARLWRTSDTTNTTVSPVAGPLSLAVMPFVNISGDVDVDYLANGIAAAITQRLHRAGLRVIPWETARRFGDLRNTIDVANALRVNAVLTGSFQMAGGRVLVNVSLVDGRSGFTKWTDKFEQPLDDIFQVQTRIAQGVATNLGHELTGERAATLARAESSSSDAYDFYLQGAENLQEGDRESTDLAFTFFGEAVKRDPNLADAHVGLGAHYLEKFWNGWGGGSAANLDLAMHSFRQALDLDRENMRARRGLNLIAFYRGRDVEGLQFAKDAASRGTDDIEVLLARGEAYTYYGPEDYGLTLLDRVLALDPENQTASWIRVLNLHRIPRFKQSAEAADDYVRRFGADSFIDMVGAHSRANLGDQEGARERYDRATEPLMQPSFTYDDANEYDITALLVAGVFHANAKRDARARELWQRGRAFTRETLAIDSRSVGMRILNATFIGLLGDRSTFAAAEKTAIEMAEAQGLNAWEFAFLAGAHARLGDIEGALKVHRDQLRKGRLAGRSWLWIAAPELLGTPGLDELLKEYDEVEQKRRTTYATPL